MLDAFLANMTQKTDLGIEPLAFGEFQSRIIKASGNDELLELYNLIADCIIGFHPKTRPVLWRVMLYQVVCANAYFKSWRKSKQTKMEEVDYVLPDLESTLAQEYSIDDNLDPRHELSIVQKLAQEYVLKAFSL